jgi:hypothetical protein
MRLRRLVYVKIQEWEQVILSWVKFHTLLIARAARHGMQRSTTKRLNGVCADMRDSETIAIAEIFFDQYLLSNIIRKLVGLLAGILEEY